MVYEKDLIKKITLRLIPFVMVLYTVADRATIRVMDGYALGRDSRASRRGSAGRLDSNLGSRTGGRRPFTGRVPKTVRPAARTPSCRWRPSRQIWSIS